MTVQTTIQKKTDWDKILESDRSRRIAKKILHINLAALSFSLILSAIFSNLRYKPQIIPHDYSLEEKFIEALSNLSILLFLGLLCSSFFYLGRYTIVRDQL